MELHQGWSGWVLEKDSSPEGGRALAQVPLGNMIRLW